MEDEFEFLLCENCKQEGNNPKLLACLHTVCAQCLEEKKPIGQCPVCMIPIQRAGRDPFQDNLLFANLQAKLVTYRKITTGNDLVCDRCKAEAGFWCSECEEFLCTKCYDAHQWYLKQKSHEAQRLVDLQSDSASKFLEAARKSNNLFCSNPTHNNHGPEISIYCRGCCKPLCCSCALLDNEHSRLYCDIRVEIEHRKEELGKLNAELMEKKKGYEKAHHSCQERKQQMEKVRDETRALIKRKVEEMVQYIQQKEEEFLGEVDKQLQQQKKDVDGEQENLQCVIKRLESSERLVEKMHLFASDQEVMDMHPFIKESLEELRKERPPMTGAQVPMGNFSKVKDQLQVLFKRVMEQKDGMCCPPSVAGLAPPVGNSAVGHAETHRPGAQGTSTSLPMYTLMVGKTPQGFVPSIISPVKRPLSQAVKSIQTFSKLMKLEDHDCDGGETSSRHTQNVRASSPNPGTHRLTPQREQRGTANSVELLENSPPEICESEVASIVISSSEETDDDPV
ncbi:protein PML-like isoform X2 [Hemicordylus capensis]|nr:protein PML-like isoform X2 [Hemicordylus capensis]